MPHDKLVWIKLIQWIKKGSVIPIIGPELLDIEIEGRTVNLYRYLAEQLADQLGIDAADIPDQNPLSYVAIRSKGFAADVLSSILEEQEFPIPKALEQLAQIDRINLFVTTTFDPLMEMALNKVRYGGKKNTNVWRYAPDLEQDDRLDLPEHRREDPRPDVFHLFGSAQDTSFAITEGDVVDYIAGLQSRAGSSGGPKNLMRELKKSNLLLLGNQFPDWLTRFFMRTVNDQPLSEQNSGATEELLADSNAINDTELQQFITLFRKDRTHICQINSATEFVNKLATEWARVNPNKSAPSSHTGTSTKIGLERGSVFISYDRAAKRPVQNITEALDAGGVGYWWDQVDITSGEDWADKIKEGINNASIFMPVISRSAVSKSVGYVFQEWQMAIEAAKQRNPDKLFILPVIIDEDTLPPKLFESRHCDVFLNGELDEAYVNRIKQLQEDFLTT